MSKPKKSANSITSNQGMGLYVHIPFCSSRCHYCDFLTFPHAEKWHEPYVQALVEDIYESGAKFGRPSIDTLFFGGGTPSMLSAKQWRLILQALAQALDLTSLGEASLEANPASFSTQKLEVWSEFGINRISLGVQSFDNPILQEMGRQHNRQQVFQDIDLLRQQGFDNISLDLIYGFQGQTPEHIEADLQAVAQLAPQHISTYQLILEEKTLLDYWIDQGSYVPLSNDDAAALGDLLKSGLAALGFGRYEISNYAQAGFESQHNLKYWTGQDYLGLGLGASSYIDHQRWQATSSLQTYLDPQAPHYFKEERSKSDDLFEGIMMGLRLVSGIDRKAYAKKHGIDPLVLAPNTFANQVEAGLLLVDPERIYLSERGLDLQNTVLIDILQEMDRG